MQELTTLSRTLLLVFLIGLIKQFENLVDDKKKHGNIDVTYQQRNCVTSDQTFVVPTLYCKI